jgi:hypothetical protein
MYSDIKLTDDPARHASTPIGPFTDMLDLERTPRRVARTETCQFLNSFRHTMVKSKSMLMKINTTLYGRHVEG